MVSREEEADNDLDEILLRDFTSEFRKGYMTAKGVCMSDRYALFADMFENFEVFDDDVWVCSFPKSGTTWTQEMVWCIRHDLDYEGAKVNLSDRFAFIEHSIIYDYTEAAKRNPKLQFRDLIMDSVSYAKQLKRPRMIKTHLPFHLLPRQLRNGETKAKIIYVCRNPKDACVSYFYHCRLLESYKGNFVNFCRLFLAGKVIFAPIWEHILGYWIKRSDANMLFLKYEDMKSDLSTVIKRTAEFLNKSISNKEVEILRDHLSFESMKSNPAVNYEECIAFNTKINLTTEHGSFMRKGKTDQWKEEMSQDMIEEFDRITEEKLAPVGLRF